jgi:type IV secretory pathway ATPase VirB11/archaellum biosynthesis ATPase
LRKYIIFYSLRDRPDEYLLAEVEAEEARYAVEKFRAEHDFEKAIIVLDGIWVNGE